MMLFWLIYLCSSLPAIQGATTVKLTLSSSALKDYVPFSDTIKICPNATEVVFKCVAENATELGWRSTVKDEEGMEIHKFNVRSEPPFDTPDGYTVYLDNNTVDSFRFTTIATTLEVAKISNLNGGEIECRAYDSMTYINDSLIVTSLDSPPRPQASNISVTGWRSDNTADNVNITFWWNDTFNTAFAITKYHASVSKHFSAATGVMCPLGCHPNESCACSGLLTSDGVNLTVSAVNCDNQEGPTTHIVIKKCQIQNLVSDDTRAVSNCGTDNGTMFSALVPNGHVCYNGLTASSVATIQCNEGHTLVGKSVLRCRFDGEWDNDFPTCEGYVIVNWKTILIVISSILLTMSIVGTIIWSILFFKIHRDSKSRCSKLTAYFGLLFVEIILLLMAVAILGIAVGTLVNKNFLPNHRNHVTVTAFILSILAITWIAINSVVCFVQAKLSTSTTKDCRKGRSSYENRIRVEKINELYYMKEEDLGDKTTKDHIYDRISCDSDRVAEVESEGNNKITVHHRHRISIDAKNYVEVTENSV